MDFLQLTNVCAINHHYNRVNIVFIFLEIKMIYIVWARYGNIVPKSDYGKIVTMIYAIFGIPVYILYFRNIGKVRMIRVN